MMFSLRAGPALLAVGLGMLAPAATSNAEPPLHHVRYTVTSDNPFWAKIYYRDTDPPSFADYSHDPYLFSPTAEADVGPGRPWVLEVMLADPGQWAMVTVAATDARVTPMAHCQLAVDGVVVSTGNGAKGALCSIRHW